MATVIIVMFNQSMQGSRTEEDKKSEEANISLLFTIMNLYIKVCISQV